jgi:glyoxylase-like metal-dependent hydrolase (beta-lactamase superfamily II)/ferredoxin
MARPSLRLSDNAPGPFYVDGTCIDCGTCWTWAPETFVNRGEHARVYRQPHDPETHRRALLARQACPVAAIGGPPDPAAAGVPDGFPVPLLDHPQGRVSYCGWADRRSFGASSYLIERPDGNLLVDVPRFNGAIARAIRDRGGLAAIVLSHRDDVAGHDRWAREFGAARWIHHADAEAAPGAELVLKGDGARSLAPGLRLIPTPGHTAGSMVLVLGERLTPAGQVLFSGDHLWWDRQLAVLVASRRYNWWSWSAQLRSVARLRDLDVRWLLPAHGDRHQLPAGTWAAAVDACLAHNNL